MNDEQRGMIQNRDAVARATTRGEMSDEQHRVIQYKKGYGNHEDFDFMSVRGKNTLNQRHDVSRFIRGCSGDERARIVVFGRFLLKRRNVVAWVVNPDCRISEMLQRSCDYCLKIRYLCNGLGAEILSDIDKVMDQHNPHAQQFLHARENLVECSRPGLEMARADRAHRQENEGKQEEDVHEVSLTPKLSVNFAFKLVRKQTQELITRLPLPRWLQLSSTPMLHNPAILSCTLGKEGSIAFYESNPHYGWSKLRLQTSPPCKMRRLKNLKSFLGPEDVAHLASQGPGPDAINARLEGFSSYANAVRWSTFDRG
ncbi:Helitron helicase-like protein [Phytophthora palmivora]|uniref:Helitron helicase-like protein n=1 Tax=Phytophthora palmivora TaxID=4796 RepID=A0A2P4X4D4_9STRA|nr:Helitron helicase-like protein [Phytophthora palmivora]